MLLDNICVTLLLFCSSLMCGSDMISSQVMARIGRTMCKSCSQVLYVQDKTHRFPLAASQCTLQSRRSLSVGCMHHNACNLGGVTSYKVRLHTMLMHNILSTLARVTLTRRCLFGCVYRGYTATLLYPRCVLAHILLQAHVTCKADANHQPCG